MMTTIDHLSLLITLFLLVAPGQSSGRIDQFFSLNTSRRKTSLIIDLFVSVISFNQPKFCPNASWNPNAVTFANSSIVGSNPRALFINSKNTIFMVRYDNGQILIWDNASVNPTRTIFANLSAARSVFVTSDEQIFVDSDSSTYGVERWTSNGTRFPSPMSNCSSAAGLFVDLNNTLYCSQHSFHQVLQRSLQSFSNATTVIAGTASPGFAPNMLNFPAGIFVTINFDLYVADYSNHRVQLFRFGERNATTVVINGSSGTMTLSYPTGIVLDADGYLFIVDQSHHRLLASGPDGFRCVAGCSGSAGSASNQLSSPFAMSFDREGNLFVADQNNDRIQKFVLSINSCGQ